MPFLFSPTGLLACCLLLINAAAFCAMGWDKRQTKHPGRRRVPERRLFLLALLGGALGATAGMFFFHHKTRHWYFRFGFPAILAAQVLLAVLLRRQLWG